VPWLSNIIFWLRFPDKILYASSFVTPIKIFFEVLRAVTMKTAVLCDVPA